MDPCTSSHDQNWKTTQVNSNQPFDFNNTLICDCNHTNDGVCHVVQMYVLLLFIYFLFLLNKKKMAPHMTCTTGALVDYHNGYNTFVARGITKLTLIDCLVYLFI